MRESIACATATVVFAMTTLTDLTTARAGLLPLNVETATAAEPTNVINVRYYGSGDFIAGNAIGVIGAFVLTNSYYPAGCGCYRSTYPHYYYHRYHYPDRFYHFGDYRSYY
jgi:hypothetical protein